MILSDPATTAWPIPGTGIIPQIRYGATAVEYKSSLISYCRDRFIDENSFLDIAIVALILCP